MRRLASYVKQEECPVCHGKRLNDAALSCKVAGFSIFEMCELEFTKLREILQTITDPRGTTVAESLIITLTRMIDIGLPYLLLNRESATLSGGEAQRLKLVRYMGSALTGLMYIFDEPSTGMHPRDVHRMTKLLKSLRDKGNTVLVVEHDKDVISIADEVIDVGPLAGKGGGEILYQGSYEGLLHSGTLTGTAMQTQIPIKANPRAPKDFLPIHNANIHNLKNISVNIPLNVLTAVTGVAGSGKSSLIREVFAKQYEDRVVFMDPVTTVCEACGGKRYSEEALSYKYHGKNIVEILEMNAEEGEVFFSDCPKIHKVLHAMVEVGLSYLSLGQPLSTLSGGERQRVKLAKYLDQKGNIYVLDEPTTGLHSSDVATIMKLLDSLVERENTVIVIEHNMDVVKLADYVIDIGPDGGTLGGEVVFTGTPKEMVDNSESITARYLRKSMQ